MLCKKKETELLLLNHSPYPFARPEQPSTLPISPPPVLPHPSCSLLGSRRFPTGSHRFPRSWRRFPTGKKRFPGGRGRRCRCRPLPSFPERKSGCFGRISSPVARSFRLLRVLRFSEVPAGKSLIPTGFSPYRPDPAAVGKAFFCLNFFMVASSVI